MCCQNVGATSDQLCKYDLDLCRKFCHKNRLERDKNTGAKQIFFSLRESVLLKKCFELAEILISYLSFTGMCPIQKCSYKKS